MSAATNLLPLREASGATKRVFGPIGPLGFPQAIAIDGKIYLGGHFAEDGDICAQTATAFDNFVETLKGFGSDMRDLVNLRTYYVYEGDQDVTAHWERFTEVRLRYLANPGPGATALRIAGAPSAKHEIGIDGVASVAPERKRIMPDGLWDWSIPTPFSQGWLIGDTIFLGGQIAADKQGRAVALGDIEEQMRLALGFLRLVLNEGGHDLTDLVTMRIGYKAGSTPEEGRANLDKILGVLRETIQGPLPTINAFGVDLLYEGLMLEIDGHSIKSRKQTMSPPGCSDWMTLDGAPVATMCGTELYVAGLSAPGGASLVAQTEASIDRLNLTLRAAGLTYDSLVKLTVYYVPGEDEEANGVETIKKALSDYIPGPGPVVSVVRVKNLPFPGQRVQLDAVAIR